jgi:Na+-driven multidrug efflux pump
MLGRIDETAVAAHVVGLRIQGLAFVPGLSVSQATSAMIGQALGAGRESEARAVTRASMVVCTLLMSALAVLLIAGAGPIVSIFDIEPGSRLEELAIVWMRVLGYGMPIVGMHIALLGVLRGAGATGTALVINLVSTIAFQIPLSFLLAFTFEMGALGVWLAFPLAFLVKLFLEAATYWRGRWIKLGLHA